MSEQERVRSRVAIDELQAGLPKDIRKFVVDQQLNLPEFSEKIHLPKQAGVPGDDVGLIGKERVQYSRIMRQEYESSLRQLMSDSMFSLLNKDEKQKALSRYITQAHVRAKNRMEWALIEKAEAR